MEVLGLLVVREVEEEGGAEEGGAVEEDALALCVCGGIYVGVAPPTPNDTLRLRSFPLPWRFSAPSIAVGDSGDQGDTGGDVPSVSTGARESEEEVEVEERELRQVAQLHCPRLKPKRSE
jgi:hypothetical protein